MTSHKEGFPVQRLEVVNTGRRRRWTLVEKLRIVEESFLGHRQVSATARRYDISPSLLFSWRKSLGGSASGQATGFVPAVVTPQAALPVGGDAVAGRMEVVTTTGRRVIVGADVDAVALARVVTALEAI
jgi:transposase